MDKRLTKKSDNLGNIIYLGDDISIDQDMNNNNLAYIFGEAIDKLADLENKIENGTLIDITEKFITEEEIKNKIRYLICEHYLTKMVVDFADNKAEAEQKLKELQEQGKWNAIKQIS